MKQNESTDKRRRPANRHFSEQYVYTGDKSTETRINLTQYDADVVYETRLKPKAKALCDLPNLLQEEKRVNWLQVSGLSDAKLITKVVTELGLNALDAKDILTPQHIVKVEEHHNKVLIILNACRYDENNRIHTEHAGIILTGNTVVTFTENDHGLLAPVTKAIKDNIFELRSKDSSMLLAFILNTVIVSLVESAVRVEELLEDIEDTLLNIGTDQRGVGSLIQQRRREYMVLRKNSQPLKEQLNKLAKAENSPISRSALPAFIDLIDQLQFINQTIDGCREIISALVDLYISNNDLRMNAIMKRLTVVSTLFIPLTFLVGVWGMNFRFMPELGWRYGYLAAWAILILVALFTWLYLRKKEWR